MDLSTGQTVVALIDTGADICLVDKRLVKSSPELKAGLEVVGKTMVRGIEGERPFIMAMTTLHAAAKELQEGEVYIEVKAMLDDLSNLSEKMRETRTLPGDISLLIGSDFLREHKARIDFRKKEVILYQTKNN
jgi:hypothetical protein